MPYMEQEIRSGEAMQVGDYQITPQTRVFRIRLPGRNSGLVWNRPSSVIVRTANGQEKILPVRDVTRVAIWSMLAGGLLGVIMIALMKRTR
jgi:hypothetical protein